MLPEGNEMLSLGAAIAKKRGEMGLSQRDLANKANVTNSTINYIERGKTKEPEPTTLRKIASALSMSVDDLYSMAGILPVRKPSSKMERIIARLATLLEGMPEHGIEEVLKYAEEKRDQSASDIEKKRQSKSG